MFFLPEWAPNIHPLIVHFPIGLLIAAFVFDALSFVLKKLPVWKKGAIILYILGAVAAIATYFTGDLAGDSVFLPTEANALLTEHADLGLWTMGFFVVYALVRLITYVSDLEARPSVHAALAVVGLGGLFLMYSTAEHGAEMVYRYGVGVQAVDHSPDTLDLSADSLTDRTSPINTSDGGWIWNPGQATGWNNGLQFPGEGQEFIHASMLDGSEHGDVLGLTVEGTPISFVYDQDIGDVQIDASLNLDDFRGIFMFIYGVVDADHYHFTAIGNGEMRQGRSENGDFYLLDTKKFDATGWQTFRVVSDGRHARAYAGEALVTHGHGSPASVGPVGLRINGEGTVRIDFMRVHPLRPIEKPATNSDNGDGNGDQ